MGTIITDRTAEASITEIIGAIAGVQALIQANVASPWCDGLVRDELGKAYLWLAQLLANKVVVAK